MTKRARTILVFIFSFLFFLVAPLIFLYSQGYRLDLEQKKFTQTGAFYFKVSPQRVDIYLNGKLKKKTDWLFRSALIENLLPKKYLVEIKKENFHSWKKELEIKGKWVTEAKNIVLIPENLGFKILAIETNKVFFAPNERKAILKKDYSQEQESSWALEILDGQRETKTPLLKDVEIPLETPKFLGLEWSPDSQRVLLEIESGEETKYFILTIQDDKLADTLHLDFLGKNVEEIFFNPQDSRKVFFIKETPQQNTPEEKKFSLYEASLETKEVLSPILEDILAYKISPRNIFWLTKQGFIFRGDLSAGNPDQLNSEPFLQEAGLKYQIEEVQPQIFLKGDQKLFILDKETRRFEPVLNSIKSFNFSLSFKKIVGWNDSEIWVLFLERQDGQPIKEAKEAVFLCRFSQRIDEVAWLTDHYLIFNTGNNIKIAEIDDRDQINIVDIGEFEDPELFFNKTSRKLYILSKNRLFVSEPLF